MAKRSRKRSTKWVWLSVGIIIIVGVLALTSADRAGSGKVLNPESGGAANKQSVGNEQPSTANLNTGLTTTTSGQGVLKPIDIGQVSSMEVIVDGGRKKFTYTPAENGDEVKRFVDGYNQATRYRDDAGTTYEVIVNLKMSNGDVISVYGGTQGFQTVGIQGKKSNIQSDGLSEYFMYQWQQNRVDEFLVKVGDKNVSLQAWDNKVDLPGLFGKPIEQTVTQLGQSSDTYNGSFVKKIKYSGAKVTLFSPKDNGKTFWIMEMELTDARYLTARDIKVGDSVQKLKEVYPGINLFPDGRTDPNNCGYQTSTETKSLTFEVNNGVIKSILLSQSLD